MSNSSGNPEVFTVVIAGSYQQFIYWCRKHDLNPRSRLIKYAMDISDIMGLGPDTRFVFYGTYYSDRHKCDLANEVYDRAAYHGYADKITYEED